jgi:hypothetical protein
MKRSSKKTWLNLMAVLGALLGTMITFTMAHAQPPNDDIEEAIVVTGVPFADGPINTSEATAAVDDPQDCHNNGSNWYMFTPTADLSVEVNTIGSDYDTTLGVYTGSPDSLSLIGCNDDFYGLQSAVHFEATANTAYFVMVGFCCGNGATGGGMLFLNIREFEIPPPLDITLAVNAQGSFDQTGVATIGGTVTCNTVSSFTEVSGTLRQRVGRRFITGDFFVGTDPCSPPSSSWSATVTGDGVFRGGQAMAEVFAFACDDFSCDGDSVTITIRLKGGKKN